MQLPNMPNTRKPEISWRWALAAFLAALAIIAYWPSPVDQPIQGLLSSAFRFLHSHGVPAWFNYKFVEAAANVALFLPLGFMASLAFRTKSWWQIGGFGLLISGCMELGQLLFLHARFASPVDVATNTLGTVLGALLAQLIRNRTLAWPRLPGRCLGLLWVCPNTRKAPERSGAFTCDGDRAASSMSRRLTTSLQIPPALSKRFCPQGPTLPAKGGQG
ncbi:VanZ family protein [Arthrobacter sp. UYEF6]